MRHATNTSAEERLARCSMLGPAPHVAAVTHEGRTTLLEQASGRYFGLSDVGTRIWELVEQRAMPLEIVERLEAEYDIAHDRLVEDTAALLSAMLGARLIRWE